MTLLPEDRAAGIHRQHVAQHDPAHEDRHVNAGLEPEERFNRVCFEIHQDEHYNRRDRDHRSETPKRHFIPSLAFNIPKRSYLPPPLAVAGFPWPAAQENNAEKTVRFT
jgi:hypothetical protein